MSIWKEYRLDECTEIKNGKSRPKINGTIPIYGGNGILDYCNVSNVKGETIIIGRVGAYCGSVYFENKIDLDMTNLSKGIYFVQTTSSQGSTISKFIKK